MVHLGNKSLLLLSNVRRPDLMEFLMLAYFYFFVVYWFVLLLENSEVVGR
jgi:hypothetical protein